MQHESEDVTDEIISTASQLADALVKDNPRFDVDRFMRAVVKGTKHE